MVAERVLGRQRKDVLDWSFFESFPEAAATMVEQKFRRTVRERAACFFRAHFERGAHQNWYDFRVYPHAHGSSVFVQSTADPAQASPGPDGGEAREP